LKQSKRFFKGQDITVLHSKFAIEPPKDSTAASSSTNEDKVQEVTSSSNSQQQPSSLQNKPDSEIKKPKPAAVATTTSFKPRGVMKSRINL
jgi:hypothetical protein